MVQQPLGSAAGSTMTGSYDPDALESALRALRHQPIGATDKGFALLGPITPAELAARQLTPAEAGLLLPLMVLRAPALHRNIVAMAEWCAQHAALLAPHAKTTMVPQIVGAQLQAGAWAVTVATVSQLSALYHFGVRRFLVANQITDRNALRWVAQARARDTELDVACYVDSEAGVRLLAETSRITDCPVPMPVLIEVGVTGGRTGVREVQAARRLAEYATEHGLVVCGVAAFEGVLGHDRSPGTLGAVRALCEAMLAVDATLPFAPGPGSGFASGGILSAGGSVFFDVVIEELSSVATTRRIVLRSGGYAVQDVGYLSLHSPLAAELECAFEFWAPVLSRPEPELALLCAGKRDLPYDLGLPTVLGAGDDARMNTLKAPVVTQLDDQHAYLRLDPACGLVPGDVVRLGGSHPCTAFDKWRAIPLLDAEDRIVDIVRTLF